MRKMAILKIENLKKSYKDLTAVNNLSMEVKEGEIHGILGPNGAGKSTTINCILGLVIPDAGKVLFEEKYSIKKWKANVGYVPQELAIYDELTAEENVKFFCSLYGMSASDVKKKTEKALDFVGLTEVKNKKAGTFSGGMKRRLNMACGIAHEPKLIIMDEPTVGIDPQSRNRILENVKKLNEGGATILYTTHYMPEVEEICNRITVVDHGQTVISGTKQDIICKMGKNIQLTITFEEKQEHIDAFVAEMEAISGVKDVCMKDNVVKMKYPKEVVVMDKVIGTSVAKGMSIINITSEEPSLEEIFLTLTGKELRDEV